MAWIKISCDELRTEFGAATAFLSAVVAEGGFTATELSGMSAITVFRGDTVPITMSGGTISFGGAPITGAEISVSNGLIDALSAVPAVG